MAFFVVGDNEYEFESSLTLLNVKQHLIKELNLSCKYIDLEFCLERPMRVLGKFNVEPGKVPRPLDKNTLSEFAFKDREVLGMGAMRDLGTVSAMIGAGMGGALLMREVNKAMMEDVRNSSDYGNAFSETTRMSSPDMFDAADNLNDVPMMLQQAQLKAAGIFEQTGSVPSSIKREIGKLEALMNTKNSMDAADDRVLEDNLFQPSRPVVENPYLGPEEAPTVGPPDPTPAQMRAMTDEIEPAMEDFGE